jgi:hypothetical protein
MRIPMKPACIRLSSRREEAIGHCPFEQDDRPHVQPDAPPGCWRGTGSASRRKGLRHAVKMISSREPEAYTGEGGPTIDSGRGFGEIVRRGRRGRRTAVINGHPSHRLPGKPRLRDGDGRPKESRQARGQRARPRGHVRVPPLSGAGLPYLVARRRVPGVPAQGSGAESGSSARGSSRAIGRYSRYGWRAPCTELPLKSLEEYGPRRLPSRRPAIALPWELTAADNDRTACASMSNRERCMARGCEASAREAPGIALGSDRSRLVPQIELRQSDCVWPSNSRPYHRSAAFSGMRQ